jgi:pyruvate ferredoxin oxidoreductase delta subunit
MNQSKEIIKGLVLNQIPGRGGKYVANWRTLKPVIDYDKCISCGLCIIYCPEAAVTQGVDKKPSIDYRFCKGCGICANECPQEAVKMKQETEGDG